MDIVTLALAKKYVNTRIADMGTLQRLQGRVDTYDDLLNISNPQSGDTYVVGTPSEENSEYMFIGDEWEKLGPMLDLSNLYTKPEVDAMFTNITNYVDDKTNALYFEGTSNEWKVLTPAEQDSFLVSIVEPMAEIESKAEETFQAIFLDEIPTETEVDLTEDEANIQLDRIISGETI